jgi:flagellar hook assembly protein FlgD
MCTWLKIEYLVDETGIDGSQIPTRLALRQNTPNPFSGGTVVAYDVPTDGTWAKIDIFDVSGRLVRTLVDGPQKAGRLKATWDGRDGRGFEVASGAYYCRMTAPDFEQSTKLLLLR